MLNSKSSRSGIEKRKGADSFGEAVGKLLETILIFSKIARYCVFFTRDDRKGSVERERGSIRSISFSTEKVKRETKGSGEVKGRPSPNSICPK